VCLFFRCFFNFLVFETAIYANKDVGLYNNRHYPITASTLISAKAEHQSVPLERRFSVSFPSAARAISEDNFRYFAVSPAAAAISSTVLEAQSTFGLSTEREVIAPDVQCTT